MTSLNTWKYSNITGHLLLVLPSNLFLSCFPSKNSLWYSCLFLMCAEHITLIITPNFVTIIIGKRINYEKSHHVIWSFPHCPIDFEILHLNFSHIHLHFSLAHNARRYLQQTREEEVIDTQRSELGQFSLSAAQLGLVFPFWKRWGTEATEILTTSASTSLIFFPPSAISRTTLRTMWDL
jgi:hypothetical protein